MTTTDQSNGTADLLADILKIISGYDRMASDYGVVGAISRDEISRISRSVQMLQTNLPQVVEFAAIHQDGPDISTAINQVQEALGQSETA